ncbi:MAG TPA: FRG domain-containing protein [Vicinamibacterales bacterium]|nr:FRG domain-containing protein [Vicinamibacterales bacterium]
MEAAAYLSGRSWVFRGHERAEWDLQTSLEREFGRRGEKIEQALYWRFVRAAPRLLPHGLIPHHTDAAAWLGLIQHYGGPTRLLDVTRSLYVALFFTFEATGEGERVVWAINEAWCQNSCAVIMADAENQPFELMHERTMVAQFQIVYSLVHRRPPPDHPSFATFQPFTGVFPLEPWQPEVRQSAQQALFLCSADPKSSFLENLAAHKYPESTVVYRFLLPSGLRAEALEQLSMMNVTAATLFPDLGGLARSLRTQSIRRDTTTSARPPWENM